MVNAIVHTTVGLNARRRRGANIEHSVAKMAPQSRGKPGNDNAEKIKEKPTETTTLAIQMDKKNKTEMTEKTNQEKENAKSRF